jgi:Na+-driven multidrug efflux pump
VSELSNTEPGKPKASSTEQQVNRLGTAKVSKLIMEFAIPAIIGLVVNGLYNIIDAIFMGHGVGTIGQATATIAMPIMIFSMAIAMLIGVGGNALAALRLGEKKHAEVEWILGNSFTLTVIASVLCTAAVFIFIDPILTLSAATEATRESSHTFIRIIAVGFILQFFGLGFNNFIRTAGDPNRALYTMVAGTIVCIVLNYFFVMVFHWGVAGSAWATVIGQGVSAALVLWYFAASKKAPFKLHIPQLKLRGRLVKAIFALGSATFVLQLSNAIINLIVNNQLNALGSLSALGIHGELAAMDIVARFGSFPLLIDFSAFHPFGSAGALAALGVVGRVAMFTFFPIMGVAMAAQPLFGYNYGAEKYQRVRTVFNISLAWIAAIGIFFWALIHLFPEPIILIFGIDDKLLGFTVHALKVQLFAIPLMGLQVLAANYFQSCGKPMKAMYLSMTRQLLYLIPLIYAMPYLMPLIDPSLRALDGVYYAFPVADILSIITAAIFVSYDFKGLNAKIREEKLRQPT